jgi:hypothetical protein
VTQQGHDPAQDVPGVRALKARLDRFAQTLNVSGGYRHPRMCEPRLIESICQTIYVTGCSRRSAAQRHNLTASVFQAWCATGREILRLADELQVPLNELIGRQIPIRGKLQDITEYQLNKALLIIKLEETEGRLEQDLTVPIISVALAGTDLKQNQWLLSRRFRAEWGEVTSIKYIDDPEPMDENELEDLENEGLDSNIDS